MSARMPKVIIRPARLDECATLSGLCLRSKGWWGYDAAFLDACRAELTIGPGDLGDLLRVADQDGAPAGIVQLSREVNDCHLEKLFVDPPFIGQGVGALLMQWAIETTRQQGASRLIIEADPGAASFYRRFGAVDAGLAPSASIPGRSLPQLVLHLD